MAPLIGQINMNYFIKITDTPKLVASYTGINCARPVINAALHVDDLRPALPKQPGRHLTAARAVVAKDHNLGILLLCRGG